MIYHDAYEVTTINILVEIQDFRFTSAGRRQSTGKISAFGVHEERGKFKWHSHCLRDLRNLTLEVGSVENVCLITIWVEVFSGLGRELFKDKNYAMYQQTLVACVFWNV